MAHKTGFTQTYAQLSFVWLRNVQLLIEITFVLQEQQTNIQKRFEVFLPSEIVDSTAK